MENFVLHFYDEREVLKLAFKRRIIQVEDIVRAIQEPGYVDEMLYWNITKQGFMYWEGYCREGETHQKVFLQSLITPLEKLIKEMF